MRKIGGALFSLFLLSCTFEAAAFSVERSVILSRQPGIFAVSVQSAFNFNTNSTLVVWVRHTGTQEKRSIWGRLINAEGAPIGQAFQIVSGPNAQSPDLIYNPSAKQFLLVYANEITGNNRFEVFAQRLNAIGRRAGPPVRVSLATDRGKSINNYFPVTIFDAFENSYVVIWTRSRNSTSLNIEQGLFGAVLNTNLTVRKAPARMHPLYDEAEAFRGPNITDLGFHGPSKKLLLTGYTQTHDPGFFVQYFVARADSTLQQPKIVLTRLKSDTSSGAAPHASLMRTFGGGMTGLFVEGSGVKKRKINNLGFPFGAVSFLFTGPVQTVPLEFPVSATSITDEGFESVVVALDDSSTGTARLFLQSHNSSGTAVRTPSELLSNFQGTSSSAVTPLPIESGNGFWYAIVFVEGAQVSSPPGPTESSGVTLLKVNTAP
jgi:hypothetical protein